MKLEPAKESRDPLSYSIVQCRRSPRNLEYCAVSYAWGKPEFSENLEIKYDDDTSYLRIIANVDALLWRFRACNLESHLWIDAICINQENEDEKKEDIKRSIIKSPFLIDQVTVSSQDFYISFRLLIRSFASSG